jgi:hypothetical protein
MKALTSYCLAEEPESNGLHNNCSTSLTFIIYTRSNSLFCWKHLCLISDVKIMSVLIYCFLFFHYQNKPLIIDMCDCLLCVEVADIKTGRKITC